jgi:hypothetical protein
MPLITPVSFAKVKSQIVNPERQIEGFVAPTGVSPPDTPDPVHPLATPIGC